MIYVASSWKNEKQQGLVSLLRSLNYEVYDFKNPEPYTGFEWSSVDPQYKGWTPAQFIEGLSHPLAQRGFDSDWSAMRRADTGILLLPCGRSAHIEAGYFCQEGKKLFILLDEKPEPELMYKMATGVHTTEIDLIRDMEDRRVLKYV